MNGLSHDQLRPIATDLLHGLHRLCSSNLISSGLSASALVLSQLKMLCSLSHDRHHVLNKTLFLELACMQIDQLEIMETV